jgi:molybdate transport system substrate-binding protein
MAAREALQSAGIWEEVQPRLVLGENVSQTLQYAQTGNVDVAIVALSLAVAAKGGQYVAIPQELHQPLDQALAVIRGTRHESQARAFANYVNSPQGREVMQRYGFALPGETPP